MRVLQNDGSSLQIDEEEILYFSTYKNTIFVHTKEGEFVLPTTLSDLLAAYASEGYERLDRSNVVNMHHVEGYNPERKVVLFRGCDQFANVAESHENRIRKFIASLKKTGP